jgi:hypothetical protein
MKNADSSTALRTDEWEIMNLAQPFFSDLSISRKTQPKP